MGCLVQGRRVDRNTMSIDAVNRSIQDLLDQSVQEGILNEQFLALRSLEVRLKLRCKEVLYHLTSNPRIYIVQDPATPNFVEEMIELYFEDSTGKMEKLDSLLRAPEVDFAQVDQLVHQFKGSSASFGAQSMTMTCVYLRDACHAHQTVTCQQLSSDLRRSFIVLQERLTQFLTLDADRKRLG